jgi:hypothetical protein
LFADIKCSLLRGGPHRIMGRATIMDSEFLTRLAHQLRAGKTPVCRRAINRILEEMKKRCDTRGAVQLQIKNGLD